MKNYRKICLFIMFIALIVTLNYFSPYLIIDGLINNVLGGAFFLWMFMFVSSLFIGRAFCSYVCPYGGLQMIIDFCAKKPLKEVSWLKKTKHVIGILWLGAIVIILAKNIGNFKIDLLYLTEKFISVDNIQKFIGYLVIVVLLSILPIFLGKRATCRYICPMSILNILGTKIKNKINLTSLNLYSNKDNCVGCKKCNKVCPMSLDVSTMVKTDNMENMECILCGECVKTCNSKAITREYNKRSCHKAISDI
jgi:ferredoxin-type protein NapH